MHLFVLKTLNIFTGGKINLKSTINTPERIELNWWFVEIFSSSLNQVINVVPPVIICRQNNHMWGISWLWSRLTGHTVGAPGPDLPLHHVWVRQWQPGEPEEPPGCRTRRQGYILSSTKYCSWPELVQAYTVCPGSSDPTNNFESNYFLQSNSYDLKLFCSVNE